MNHELRATTALRNPPSITRQSGTLGAMLLMTCLATTAYAQETDPTPTQAASVAGAQEEEEILVTAQRREERLQDVPLSVTALNEERLEDADITRIGNLTTVTPGLRVEKFGTNLQPSIRGVTTSAAPPGAESNVTLTVDGVYMANQSTNAIPLPDTERVEVLRGPQGTLFGRNASGGAMLIYTRDPEFTPTGNVTVGYGRFDSYSVEGFVTAPLVDNRLAFSLAGLYELQGGYIDDLLNGGDTGDVRNELIRAKLLFRASPNMDWLLTGVYAEARDESLAYYALNGNTRGLFGPGPLATEPYTTSSNHPTFFEISYWNVALRGDIDIGWGTVTTTTSYMETDVVSSSDADASPTAALAFDVNQPDAYWQQEVVLATDPFGPVSFTTGLFYFNSSASYEPLDTDFFGTHFITRGTTGAEAWAAFAEANFDITSSLRAIVGGRYSSEERRLQYNGGPEFSETFDAFTPRLSLIQELSPETNIYATWSQGFKSGVFDMNSGATAPVEPEEVTAYEIGVKHRGGALAFNAAAFYNDYQDMQVAISAGTVNRLANAGRVESYGVELDATFQITPEFSITAGAAWLHAEYADFSNAQVVTPRPLGDGNMNAPLDVSGFQVIRSPEWTFSLNADYERETSAGVFGANLNVYHSDEYPLEIGSRLIQDPYTMVGGRLSFAPANTNFRIDLWGRNLLDEEKIATILLTSGGDAVTNAPPLTYGVRLNYQF